jgi:hypothetical protein
VIASSDAAARGDHAGARSTADEAGAAVEVIRAAAV